MCVLVFLQQVLNEWTWYSEDHLVSTHLLPILTGQGHISEVCVSFQDFKGCRDVFLEVIPF